MGVIVRGCPRCIRGFERGLYEDTLVLAFADYTKDFLLETDVSKGLGAVLSQKQADG